MPPKVAAPPAAVKSGAVKEDKPEESAVPVSAEDEEEALRTGCFSFLDGAKYQGEYVVVDGHVMRQGTGTFVNGPERYEGAWLKDEMHGAGAYLFATGTTYEGEFQSNVFHGHGTYRWTDGAHYTGEWQHNRMHGQGRYVDKDGVEWAGRFFNGKYDNGRVFHTLR